MLRGVWGVGCGAGRDWEGHTQPRTSAPGAQEGPQLWAVGGGGDPKRCHQGLGQGSWGLHLSPRPLEALPSASSTHLLNHVQDPSAPTWVSITLLGAWAKGRSGIPQEEPAEAVVCARLTDVGGRRVGLPDTDEEEGWTLR